MENSKKSMSIEEYETRKQALISKHEITEIEFNTLMSRASKAHSSTIECFILINNLLYDDGFRKELQKC